MIWTHGRETLDQFLTDFNAFHPTINLTSSVSDESINFLDTTIKLSNGRLETTLYRKPTDRYSYLHASSFHPRHVTKSIVYSQALRYNRICSDQQDRNQHLSNLAHAFKQLNYKPKVIEQQITRAKQVPRENLLRYQPKSKSNRLALVVTYSPRLRPLQRIINDLQPILDEDDSLKQSIPEKPMLAYKQPPNLKKLLVSSSLPNPDQPRGTFPCNKPRCKLCPHINPSITIQGPNNATFSIKGSFSCTSTNVIYAITCPHCPSAVYIGQTGQTLRQRMNGHKFDIRSGNNHKPIGDHFNQPGHSIDDFRVAVLRKKDFKNTLDREIAEQTIIQNFNCVELGLNRDYGFMSNYRD